MQNGKINVERIGISYKGKKKGRTRWRNINELKYVKGRYKERNKYVWSIMDITMKEENEFQGSTSNKNTIRKVDDNEGNKFIIQVGNGSFVKISKMIIPVERSNLEGILIKGCSGLLSKDKKQF